MSGDVPEIYWYVFWVGLAIVMEAFGFYMATIIHRRNMKVLELLRPYAERGIEPPAGLAELLGDQRHQSGSSARGARLQRFVGLLFAACVTAGVAWWLTEDAGPRWALYTTVCAAAFFSISAIGFLLAAVVTPER